MNFKTKEVGVLVRDRGTQSRRKLPFNKPAKKSVHLRKAVRATILMKFRVDVSKVAEISPLTVKDHDEFKLWIIRTFEYMPKEDEIYYGLSYDELTELVYSHVYTRRLAEAQASYDRRLA